MGYKDEVHQDYVAEQLAKHGAKIFRDRHRFNVVVVGDNQYQLDHPELFEDQGDIYSNIGNMISSHLRSIGHQVIGWDKSDIPYGWAIDAETEVLVCCTGTTHLDWIESTQEGEISEIITNTLHAPIMLTRQFVRQTIESPNRKMIVYIGSMAYNHVLNASSVYCAAKAGLAMFSRCMAWELAPKAYDVFTIHPSNVAHTPMSEHTMDEIADYRGLSGAEAYKYWTSAQVRGDMLTKRAIAELVEVLLYGRFGYVSGSQIELGGGAR